MVYYHVKGVINEVSDGEADEGVAGGCECGYQIILHPRSLVVKLYSQTGENVMKVAQLLSAALKINLSESMNVDIRSIYIPGA